jgi:hypothetical protein
MLLSIIDLFDIKPIFEDEIDEINVEKVTELYYLESLIVISNGDEGS